MYVDGSPSIKYSGYFFASLHKSPVQKHILVYNLIKQNLNFTFNDV